MAVSVLIVTPTTAFGEIIRQALTEDGGYRPILVFDAQEAMRQASQQPFEVVILDNDLRDLPLAELEQALRRSSPSIRLIVIPRKGDLSLPGLTPDLFLTKPFYMPDLLEKLDEILSPVPVQVSEKIRNELAADGHPAANRKSFIGSQAVPPWLEDVTRAAQHLTRLSLETSAQASLITRDCKLWAYAGHLPQSAAAELAAAVLKDYDWRISENVSVLFGDLARFIHLKSTDCDYMLYATSLGDKMVLAMAFDAQMPFSKMRAQTGSLARALASPPSQDHNQLVATGGADESDLDEATNIWIPESDLDDRLAERLEQPIMAKEDILSPSPLAPQIQKQTRSGNASVDNEEPASQVDIQQASSGASNLSDQPTASTENQPKVGARASVSPDDTIDLLINAPVTSSWHRLSFALVLLPRLPKHFITGDLADQLSETVQRLSLSFGWRLEHLAVRPEYLQIVVTLPPEMSPEAMVTNLKKYTSLWIFEDFPRLGRENPSGDFWAQGYLLITATQPPAYQVLRTFIEQTRRVQGIPGRK